MDPLEARSGDDFKMACPKCWGYDYSITRDNRTFGAEAQAFEYVYHCRCGKQMFGKQIFAEYDVQRADWKENPPEPPPVDQAKLEREAEEAERKEHLRRTQEYRRQFLAEQRRAKKEEANAREEEAQRRWREKVDAPIDGSAPRPTAPRKPIIAPKPPKKKPVVAKKPAPKVVAPAPAPKPAAAAPAPAEKVAVTDENRCAWHLCTNASRNNSKYCSRACSNKNARMRHKQRKR